MTTDQIEIFIGLAHQIFDQHSVYDVINFDRITVRSMLYSLYPRADQADVEGYLDIVGELSNVVKKD